MINQIDIGHQVTNLQCRWTSWSLTLYWILQHGYIRYTEYCNMVTYTVLNTAAWLHTLYWILQHCYKRCTEYGNIITYTLLNTAAWLPTAYLILQQITNVSFKKLLIPYVPRPPWHLAQQVSKGGDFTSRSWWNANCITVSTPLIWLAGLGTPVYVMTSQNEIFDAQTKGRVSACTDEAAHLEWANGRQKC